MENALTGQKYSRNEYESLVEFEVELEFVLDFEPISDLESE